MNTKSILLMILAVLITFSGISSVNAYEVRGTVSDGVTPLTWNAKNFAGFYYDIDNDLSSETLSITGMSSRTLTANSLTYTTTPVSVSFEYSKDKNLPVYDSVKTYSVVGWQAEKWVALNGRPNKLVKLIKEFNGDEKASLQGGSTLNLGNGYVLKINAVDARSAPRQAWISIMKDGVSIDDGVLQQSSVYNLRKTVGGEEGALVLSLYVDTIFSGTERDMIQLKYIWLIDEKSLVTIDSGDKFSVFEVTGINPITLKNTNSISLSQKSETTLMGNMKFKVADNANLRFYPFVDITDNVSSVTNTNTVVSIPTVTSTPINCTPVEKIVEKEKIVYVNVTVTPEPTVVPTVVVTVAKGLPGFEGIFAIVGLIAVAFLVIRQRK